jgi:hypothetical protein
MRAREFITEEKALPSDQGDPLTYVYRINGLFSSDTYQTYRVGVAMARARSDAGTDGITNKLPAWSPKAAFGEEAVIGGFDASVEPIIDQALAMAGLSAKKIQISSPNSLEPASVQKQSPVRAFAGYPR